MGNHTHYISPSVVATAHVGRDTSIATTAWSLRILYTVVDLPKAVFDPQAQHLKLTHRRP